MKADSTTPTFLDVKAILDWLVKGKLQRLHVFHGTNFGWGTKNELAAATVQLHTIPPKVFRLIDPALVGNGKGCQTFLVQALTTGVPGYPRMPYLGNDEGQYASPEQLVTLTNWIDAGMPD